MQKILAVTLGDPAGIGPELALRALADREMSGMCRLFVYGSRRLLVRVAEAARVPFPDGIAVLPPPAPAGDIPREGHVLFDFPFDAADAVQPGRAQAVCGLQAYRWIEAAARDALAGRADALVTGPVSKEALHLAGVPFPGHTEMLGHLTGTSGPCMIFHSPEWVMGLVTIHEALADVPRLLTVERVLRTIRMTHEGCVRFGGVDERNRMSNIQLYALSEGGKRISNVQVKCASENGGTAAVTQRYPTSSVGHSVLDIGHSAALFPRLPRIGVLAFNPHAGEGGLFGGEEARVIAPAIEQARSEGLDVSGPLVPDTAFAWRLRDGGKPPFDAYVAMYHDQGLIPFKMVAFDTGVNVTMGLPFIRTSPDHGTAFDLAWQGRAKADSFMSAVRLAAS